MKLREVKIKNFRCLQNISFPVDDTTVLIGENNSGKTAALEAIRIAISRSIQGKGLAFDEYDYFMALKNDSPQKSDGIEIELWFREDKRNEWLDSLIQVLNEIIQTDVESDIDSIGYKLTSKYDSQAKEFVTKCEFLNLDGQPLSGKGASSINLSKFQTYIRIFYLTALRDASEEFSARSQFWGRILRNLEIPGEQIQNLNEELVKLNEDLLHADNRLEQVRTTLENAQNVMALRSGQSTSIQALSVKPWELMSKSQVVIKPMGSEIDFPLSHHGQGIQSLAVIFLFQAYIDVLLKPLFQPETEAILALEEPESHLHPQAIRALAANLDKIKSQKIISCHSPYFIQEIPFTKVRMFCRKGTSSSVLYLRRFFTIKMPNSAELATYCGNSRGKFEYKVSTSILKVNGKIEEKEYRDLVQLFPGNQQAIDNLKELRSSSELYINDLELADLATYAQRMRGEILFAKAWILCEGQCEYLLLRYFSEIMEKPLDQLGISVIDFQNNGSPSAFIGLAHTFEIPWIMTCDSDDAGKNFIESVKNRGVSDLIIAEWVYPLSPDGTDLEMFLAKNGYRTEYMQILANNNIKLTKKPEDEDFDEELVEKIQPRKTEHTIALIQMLKANNIKADRVPKFYSDLINKIAAKVG
jgi:putative ATP-dependent endonuclease of OLD family